MAVEFIADTSAWVSHFKGRINPDLVSALQNGRILLHSLVYGELVLGGIEKNREAAELLQLLPRPIEATYDEVLAFIRAKHLSGEGIGWIDASLLASAVLTGCKILTEDKALKKLC